MCKSIIKCIRCRPVDKLFQTAGGKWQPKNEATSQSEYTTT